MAVAGLARKLGYAAAAALLGLAPPLLADTQAGVEAWEAGDYERAVREWEEPAAAGDADAQFNLAQAYRMGRGVAEDTAKAEALYAASAAQGNLRAADNYGVLLYLRGEYEAALPLVTGAAGRDDPRAQYLLGTAYFNGGPVERDWPRAYAYMILASKAGLPQAAEALGQMESHLSADDRSAGRKLLATLGTGTTVATAAAPARPPAEPVVAPKPAATASVKLAAATPAPKRTTGQWRVQLGSFAVPGNAQRMWGKLKGRAELAGKSKLETRSGKLTVLYATGFASQAEAQRSCRTLRQSGIDCLVIR